MPLENAEYIAELVQTNPPGTDNLSESDDHHRVVKKATYQSFPFIDKQVNLTSDQINGLVGMLGMFMNAVAPTPADGWLLCDGSIHLNTDYPYLAAKMGNIFGGTPGTNFGVPRPQGYILRVRDRGAGNDPDVATRAPRPDGIGGDVVGSVQNDEFRSHTHPTADNVATGTGDRGSGGYSQSASTSGASGGAETRMINFYMDLYIHT